MEEYDGWLLCARPPAGLRGSLLSQRAWAAVAGRTLERLATGRKRWKMCVQAVVQLTVDDRPSPDNGLSARNRSWASRIAMASRKASAGGYRHGHPVAR